MSDTSVSLCKTIERHPGAKRMLGLQLLRSGTSIGANVEEAQAGQSRADFISKYAIALKEARETLYWLRLLEKSNLIEKDLARPLIQEANEICKILGAILASTERRSATSLP